MSGRVSPGISGKRPNSGLYAASVEVTFRVERTPFIALSAHLPRKAGGRSWLRSLVAPSRRSGKVCRRRTLRRQPLLPTHRQMGQTLAQSRTSQSRSTAPNAAPGSGPAAGSSDWSSFEMSVCRSWSTAHGFLLVEQVVDRKLHLQVALLARGPSDRPRSHRTS